MDAALLCFIGVGGYVVRAVKTAAASAIMAPRVGKKPLSRAGMNFFNPNQRKNKIVNQSAITDMSMASSPLLKLILNLSTTIKVNTVAGQTLLILGKKVLHPFGAGYHTTHLFAILFPANTITPVAAAMDGLSCQNRGVPAKHVR